MRKLLLGVGLLVLLAGLGIGVLLASGAISHSSLRMVLNVMAGVGGPAADDATVEAHYRVPAGFSVRLYAADLPRARFLRFTPAGDLLVSRPHAGDIVLLRRDADGDALPDARETLLSGLRRPLGLDLADGWLYIAESNRISRYPFDSAQGRITGAAQTLIDDLTDNGNHWSKTLRIGPDGALYLAQGSTCNVCVEDDARRATLMRFTPEGRDGEIIATGLRNSVGFDWAPWDGALYATDNGRDLLGDDFPPCELNRIEAGRFYGWPYFNGDNVPDPDMGPDPQSGTRAPAAPVHAFAAHNAPLGITFLDASADWPPDYRQAALVALHGSWNRSAPDGYKVVSLHWAAGGILERDFLTGLLRDGTVSGRPVDVAQGPDGAVYISDDYAGAIYRVSPGTPPADGGVVPRVVPGVVPRDVPRDVPQDDVQAGSRLDASPPPWLQGADLTAMAARGRALYDQYDCAACHERGVNPRRLDGLSDRLGYTALLELLAAPPPPMPTPPLSEDERRELAVFLLTAQTR